MKMISNSHFIAERERERERERDSLQTRNEQNWFKASLATRVWNYK